MNPWKQIEIGLYVLLALVLLYKPPNLALEVALKESGFNQNTVSPAGAGNQRNYRIRHTLMDTCANGQSFYNLVNATVNAQGTFLLESTNHNCALGLDNTGDCYKVFEITELIAGGGFVSASSVQIQSGSAASGGTVLH